MIHTKALTGADASHESVTSLAHRTIAPGHSRSALALAGHAVAPTVQRTVRMTAALVAETARHAGIAEVAVDAVFAIHPGIARFARVADVAATVGHRSTSVAEAVVHQWAGALLATVRSAIASVSVVTLLAVLAEVAVRVVLTVLQ